MITWMQRHKKWLIITIWISTIAFIGAGFVGWGQYSYGNKAGAVAKVGDIKISQSQLQKEYSRLYNKYNQIFQGNFDKEKAKKFGLDKQALQALLQQALILNLAKAYDITVSDKEIVKELQSQEAFKKDGLFNKEIYKQILSQNRLTPIEYEQAIKRELTINKTIKLLPVEISKNEENVLDSIFKITDKIEYKLLTLNSIKIDVDDKELKAFWQTKKNNFMTEANYNVNYIKQAEVKKEYTATKINDYYKDNRMHFRDKDGKILSLDKAKNMVIAEMNKKATKKEALRTFLALKKSKLDKNTAILNTTISESKNQFTTEVLKKVSKASITSPYIKPILINGTYYIFELVKTTPSKPKTFAQAKAEVLPIYIQEKQKNKILNIASKSVNSFKGDITDYISVNESNKLTKLTPQEANTFLKKLFVSDRKKGFIKLNDGNIVLYNILEQKMLSNTNIKLANEMKKLKSAIFNEGLINKLQKIYQTKIYIKGL